MIEQQPVRVEIAAQLEIIKRQRNEASDTAAAWEAAYYDLLQSSQQTVQALQQQISLLTEGPPPESEG
jgi:hypothetical protein